MSKATIQNDQHNCKASGIVLVLRFSYEKKKKEFNTVSSDA